MVHQLPVPRREFASFTRAVLGRSVCAACVALSLSALGCLSVESEFTEVELNRQDLRIPGAQSWVTAPIVTFDHPYATLRLPDEFRTELRPRRCVLTADGGVEGLDFIDGFTLEMSAADPEGLPRTQMFAFRRDETTPAGPVVVAEAVEQPNVLDYWETGTTVYTLSIDGQLPEREWSLDVSALFHGEAALEL